MPYDSTPNDAINFSRSIAKQPDETLWETAEEIIQELRNRYDDDRLQEAAEMLTEVKLHEPAWSE